MVKRSTLEKLMPYCTALGPHGDNYLADEDSDMYLRLMESGAKGLYLPDLIVYHYIHPERLSKRYFRRWCFRRGISSALLDRIHPKNVPYFLGVPRYLFGEAARAASQLLKDVAKNNEDSSENFSNELCFWDLAGFFYGKHFYRGTKSPNGSLDGMIPYSTEAAFFGELRKRKNSRQRLSAKPAKNLIRTS